MEARARADNWGIGTPEILPGNIGYLEIRSFGFPPEVIEDAVAKAMTAVADADALILDVRRNGGGSPFAVALVSSYLLARNGALPAARHSPLPHIAAPAAPHPAAAPSAPVPAPTVACLPR